MRRDDFFFYLSLVCLIPLVYRIVTLYDIVSVFPVEDYSANIAKLWFLENYGLYKLAPNWYRGVQIFSIYPPGLYFVYWFFHTIISNILLSQYLLVIFLIILAFFVIYISFSEILSFSRRLFMFCFLFSTPYSLSYFLSAGRLPELLGWILFVPIFAILWKIFNEQKLTGKCFLLLSFLLAFLILTYPIVLVFIIFFFIPTFFTAKSKIKIKIILSLIFSFLLTSFWSVLLITNWSKGSLGEWAGSWGTSVFIETSRIAISISLFVSFYYFYKQNNENRKILLFFAPLLILSFLHMSKLILYIPLLNKPYPHTYHWLFLIFTLFFILQIKFQKLKKWELSLLRCGIIISVVICLLVSSSAIREVTIKKFPVIFSISKIVDSFKDKNIDFVIMPELSQYVHAQSLYSYATVYYNFTTPFGWLPQIAPQKINLLENQLNKSVIDCDCYKIKTILYELKIRLVFSYQSYCSCFEKCGGVNIKTEENICVYNFTSFVERNLI